MATSRGCSWGLDLFSLWRAHLTEDPCHLEGPGGVHVGGDDWDARVGLLGVTECEGPLEIHLQEPRTDQRYEGRSVNQSIHSYRWCLPPSRKLLGSNPNVDILNQGSLTSVWVMVQGFL